MTTNDAALQTTLTVRLGEAPKDPASPDPRDTYEFAIPTLHDEIRIGSRMRRLRAAIDPEWDGFTQGLDAGTSYTLRACATLEELLKTASVRWPFSPDAKGAPAVDSSKWSPRDAMTALDVFAGFTDELVKFRSGLDAATPPGTAGE